MDLTTRRGILRWTSHAAAGWTAVSGGFGDPRSRRCAAVLAALVAILVLGAPVRSAAQTDAATDTRPNILVFLADDMGWGQAGFNGGTEVTTPGMDRIANEGVKLTQFYVHPVCTATRGALLTGRYPWKNGTETRVGLRESSGMLTDERTIAQTLGDAGYATWIVGKWHLGQWQQAHLPLQRGFDHHYGHYSGEIHSFTLHRGRTGRGILDWHRNERPVVESGYSTFLMANEAIQLIQRHDGESPFFLYLPFNAVHNPNQAPDEYIDAYKDLDDGKQRAQLKAMDDAIGWVIAAMAEKGVLDNTLVMFLNDNGGAQSAGRNEPYRGKKSGFFEGGIRVPAVIRWPAEIDAGSVSDAMLHVVDLFPTFAGLAEADTSTGLALDGLDAWGAIADGEASPRDEIVFADGVIRKGDWKLIDDYVDLYDPAPDSVLLYNIEDDPYETRNRAGSNTAKVTELRERLVYHLAFARDGETLQEIPDHPPKIYGAQENTAFGSAAKRAVSQRRKGNLGPTLVRIAASKARVALVYDEMLDADSVPTTDAFTVVENPEYNSVQVTGVAVDGSEIVLTLGAEVTAGNTVGVTYEVPDSGAIKDADGLEAVGVVWVTDEAEDDATFTVTAAPDTIAEGDSATLTVAVTNGVTFADDQTVTLAVSGTASTSDYSVPGTLTLMAGTTSVTGALAALDDQEDEADETLTVAATHDDVAIGSATVTIQSISHDATLDALSLSGIDIGTFSSTLTAYTASVALDIATTTVTATANHAEAVVSIDPGTEVSLADGENQITVTVTAEDGTTTQTYTVTVTRGGAAAVTPPQATITADAASVTEGTAAAFTVTLDESATQEVTLAVTVTQAGSVISGTAPASLTIGVGETSAALSVATEDDAVVETDGTVTATLASGTGYALGSDGSAEVSVTNNDTATFTVAENPAMIDEGESATLTVSVSNAVTFADDQVIELALSGSAATTDYTLMGTSLTLLAGTGSVTATLTAVDDADEEDAETVVVTASLDGTALGSATVTIAASDDPPLTAQFLDMPQTHDGATPFTFELRFSEEIRVSFRTLRDEAFEVTGGTVTRAKRQVRGSNLRWQIAVRPASDADVVLVLPPTSDCAASDAVCTSDGEPLSNRLEARVTRPKATITSHAASVTEGTAVAFTVTLSGAATQAVTVALSVAQTGEVISGTAPASVSFAIGETSKILSVSTDDDAVVEDDGTVTATLASGTGYILGSEDSADVSVADNDTATFTVAANPTAIDEGASSTLTVSVSNAVTFADDQTIGLVVSGSAAASDYTLTGTSLTLGAGADSVTATLAAVDDADREDAETVVVTASLDGAMLGSATVMIAASDETLSDDATLRSLALSGVDIGSFSSATTSYTASVASDVATAEVTAAANSAGASVLISDADGSTAGTSRSVSLNEGSNAITVTVTAEDGETEQAYRVTVTRDAGIPATPQGFDLHSANQYGTGLWSDGTLMWVSDWSDEKLYAYLVSDGARRSGRDIDVASQPVGLWSDGALIWVAHYGGGLRAHRLSDGTRVADRDIAAADNGSPMGVWSDGTTLWVLDFSDETAHAYRLSDGARVAASDLVLADGEAVTAGIWMDSTTAWAADWTGDRLSAFQRSDGSAQRSRDIALTLVDSPTGMWSNGQWMWVMNWGGNRVHVVALPPTGNALNPNAPVQVLSPSEAGTRVLVPDPALRAGVAMSLSKAPGAPVGVAEMAALRTLSLRGLGVTELTGLEHAANLVSLDLGHNPVTDLRPLASLGRLSSLNLDGVTGSDLYALAWVPSLRRLSLRSSSLAALAPLEYLHGLEELDIGDNAVADLYPLAGLAGLRTLRADRNRITDLTALDALTGLRALNLASNGVTDLYALSRLARLESLDLANNRVAELYPLAGLDGLRRLFLGGNAVADLRALSDLAGLELLGLHGNPVVDLSPVAHPRRRSVLEVFGGRPPRDREPPR